MTHDYHNIRVAIADSIATLTVDRPQTRNALDRETTRELHDALSSLADDAAVNALILTGGSDSAFVSGADIKDLRARTVADGLVGINSALFSAVERFPWPTIAAINGYALGGGCELALACDIRIAAASAKLGQPELRFGIIPGAGGTQRLPRLIGLGRAKHLILTGEIIDAARAYDIGLVTAVVEASELQLSARDCAMRIVRHGPMAIRLAKLALNASSRVDLDSGLLIEKLAQAICFGSDDKREGTTAFLEKRQPAFTGR